MKSKGKQLIPHRGMNLNRLPLLIRDSAIAAYKNAQFPVAYNHALEGIQKAIDALDLAELAKQDVGMEFLASLAKAANDDQAKRDVERLTLAKAAAAWYAADVVFNQKRAEIVAKHAATLVTWAKAKGVAIKPHLIASAVAKLTPRKLLTDAGFSSTKVTGIVATGRLSTEEYNEAFDTGKSPSSLIIKTAGRGAGLRLRSAAFNVLLGRSGNAATPLVLSGWCRNHGARGLAIKVQANEREQLRARAELLQAWCIEFLRFCK